MHTTATREPYIAKLNTGLHPTAGNEGNEGKMNTPKRFSETPGPVELATNLPRLYFFFDIRKAIVSSEAIRPFYKNGEYFS